MLNLLPAPYKEELKNGENFRLAFILGTLVLCFLVSFFLLLLSIRIYVGGQIEAQRIYAEVQQKDGGEESPVTKIRLLNSTVVSTSSFYEEQVMFSGILSQITDLLPENVYAKSLHYSPSSGMGEDGQTIIAEISLSGVAPTIDVLLALKTNLENDAAFSTPEIPPGIWKDPSAVDVVFLISFDVYSVAE